MADQHHPLDMYSSTSFGPQGPRERRRLKPGDRLANGEIWTGDSKLQGLNQQRADILTKMEVLKADLKQVEVEIVQLEQEMSKEEAPAEEEEPAKKQKSSSRRKAVENDDAKQPADEPAASDT